MLCMRCGLKSINHHISATVQAISQSPEFSDEYRAESTGQSLLSKFADDIYQADGVSSEN